MIISIIGTAIIYFIFTYLLKKFGILNATKNASVDAEAPKILANTTSLINPEIREMKVIPLTVAEDLISDFD